MQETRRKILISIKPKWCAKIMNGEKTIEVRKNKALAKAIQKLINENGYAEIYVYCSKLQNGKLNTLSKMKNGEYKIISNANDVLKQIDEIEKAKLTGKVVFKFRCYKVEEIESRKYSVYCFPYTETLDDYELLTESCLTVKELDDYLGYDRTGYAIHISDLEIFDKPKELREFSNCDPYPYTRRLTRAPQSWQYVEEE